LREENGKEEVDALWRPKAFPDPESTLKEPFIPLDDKGCLDRVSGPAGTLPTTGSINISPASTSDNSSPHLPLNYKIEPPHLLCYFGIIFQTVRETLSVSSLLPPRYEADQTRPWQIF
jgi:hypothetical protein